MRWAPTPSRERSESLRVLRTQLLADRTQRGRAFGSALATAVDDALVVVSRKLSPPASTLVGGRWALLALGSYARRELTPGSDLDVLLLHDGRIEELAADAAETLWYPLWDAGFVLGHAIRTTKETVALATDHIDVLTALLEVRLVAGDSALADDLVTRVRSLAGQRRTRFVEALAAAAEHRFEQPGAIAEMLEPNLKDGAGGLRDLESLQWAGFTLGEPGGTPALVRHGYLQAEDLPILTQARDELLDLRVALHRETGGRRDLLTLQDQDAVAAALGVVDANALVRSLAATARAVTWIETDVWRRLRSGNQGPSRWASTRELSLGQGIIVRDGAVALTVEAAITPATLMAAAANAAMRSIPIERVSLERFRVLGDLSHPEPRWDPASRASFIELLGAGRSAIPVIESLDQVGAMVPLIPEWNHVRARPQRNAYHRFTVDRHSLEAVAESVALLEAPDFDGEVARRTRSDLLLLGALLHDFGKGLPGDHSASGAEIARSVAERMGIDEHGVSVLIWLVRHHLLLADTATRRDLTDDDTIVFFGEAVGDTERLDLQYALTVADSRATGPAAWSAPKGALVRQLFVATSELLQQGVIAAGHDVHRRVMLERHHALIECRELTIEWGRGDDGLLECAIAAPDQQGLLATVAGVLALHGFDIRSASVYGTVPGMALEVYRGEDRFDRLDGSARQGFARDLAAALEGKLSVRDRLDAQIHRYRRPRPGGDETVVFFDLAASSSATIVEVHAPDEVGLLAKVAAVFADLDLDVTAALVSTLGERVVDVFYVRDANGAKLTQPLRLDRLRATLFARLVADYRV